MKEITTVGVDLAKVVFTVHGVDAAGHTVLRKTVRRERLMELIAGLPPCLIGMEACGGAHEWARKFQVHGHRVGIMMARFVAAYRKSSKNDGNDAEAICEAVGRPNMRFVPVKSAEQQAILALHRVRQGFIEQRTATVNRIRGLLAEFGMVLPQRADQVRRAAVVVAEALPVLCLRVRLLPICAHTFRTSTNGSPATSGSWSNWRDNVRRRYAFSVSRVLGRSPPRPSPPASATGTNSPTVGSSRRGWDWCHGNIRPVARRAWAGSPSAAMPICERC